MSRTNVAVLRGGASPEYDISLRTGAAVLQALPENTYDTQDVFIDRAGRWHSRGLPSDPMRIVRSADVVFNALHGGHGEGGMIQRTLEHAGVPFTGSRQLPSAMTLNKGAARDALRGLQISMPGYAVFARGDERDTVRMARDTFSLFGPPYIIKPLRGGSGIGVRMAQTFPELPDVLADVLEQYDEIIVEELIPGEEIACGVVEGFRDQDIYALPPTLLIPHATRPFFDYTARFEGLVSAHCPAPVSYQTKAVVEEYARIIHEHMGLSHYSNSDFILHPSGRIYFLEVNSLPGLTQYSHFPHALNAVGSSIAEFADHTIQRALSRR
jgi:D-alanine-D-alanine ligase